MLNASKLWRGRTLVAACVAMVFCLVVSVPSMFSQSPTTGALTGTIKDSSGAAVPNATVTATNIGTAQAHTTMTDADGTYKMGLLPPGAYKLRIEATGFSSVDVPSVTVNVTETAVLDQTLQVGSTTTNIEVTTQAEAVETASTTLGTVMNAEDVTSSPLTTRNYTNLLGLSAGANSSVFNASNIGKGTTEISVNGATTAQNNYQQDGAPIVAWTGNGFAGDSGASPGIAVVNPDSVEEFKIQTSMFDAGYGRKPGAVVNVVTKSGSNQFHGDAFEFFRNTVLNANDFFRQLNYVVNPLLPTSRPVLNQNQYGGVIGGPIKKDKLFFFASFQETWQKNGLSAQGSGNPTLPPIPVMNRGTLGAPNAAFVTALGAEFCPGGPGVSGKAGSTLNGPAIQTVGFTSVNCNGSNINPIALNLLELKNPDGTYYIPGSGAAGQVTEFLSSPASFREHQAVGNLDYVIDPKNTLALRWTYSNALTDDTFGCSITKLTIQPCLAGTPATVTIPTIYGTMKLTTTLTNNLVNEARASIQRIVGQPLNQIPFTDSQVGIAPLVPGINYLNTLTLTGLFTGGAALSNASVKWNTSYEFADQISWSHGKHTVRTGFEYERDRQNWHFIGLAIGSETFKTFQDFLLGLSGCAPGTVGSPACTASTTAGITNGTAQSNISSTGTSVGITPPGGETFQFRAPTMNAFVQDDFKATSNLTLNIGVRWEFFGLNYAQNGLNNNYWVPLIATVPNSQLGTTPATGTLAGLVVPSNFPFASFPPPPVGGLFQNSLEIPTATKEPLANFGPRIGLAWKPFSSDRFVFRSGFGMFYDRAGNTIYNKSAAQGSPYLTNVGQSAAANWYSNEASVYCTTPTPGIACNAPALGWVPRYFNPATGIGSNIAILSTNEVYLVPITYEWNANVQYEFLHGWVVELGYVGSHGIHQVPDATEAANLEHNANQPLLASAASPLDCGTAAVPGPCITTNTSGNAPLRVPYLGFAPTGIGVDQTIGAAKFNSLQATVTKHLSHGMTLNAAYTWARGTTTASFIQYNDATQPLQYGLMPYLRPQRLSVNYAYELPFGKHEGMLDKLTSGWVVSGVTVVTNGYPLTLTDANGGNIYGNVQSSTPTYAAGMTAANIPTTGPDGSRLGLIAGTTGWFNKTAFFSTLSSTNNGYGNVGYSVVSGPGQFNWDISLVKTTKVGGINENATLVFRSEFFNAFNHPQFQTPSSDEITSSTFGQINSASVNPRLIQFALKYVF
jgi:carboxypeptidase family protein